METQTHAGEMEDGIFNMVVSLCQQKAAHMPMAQAKAEVADYLKSLADGLENIKE